MHSTSSQPEPDECGESDLPRSKRARLTTNSQPSDISLPLEPGPFIYTPLSLQREEIRLLKILQPRADEDGISCELITVALADKPSYQALSYVWGNPIVTTDITVNGKLMPVTRNLFSALRDVRALKREPDRSQSLFWADAISINQTDFQEKNHQVQLMRRIYSGADLVIAWLGPDQKETRYAFSMSRLIAEQVESIPANPTTVKNSVEDEKSTLKQDLFLDQNLGSRKDSFLQDPTTEDSILGLLGENGETLAKSPPRPSPSLGVHEGYSQSSEPDPKVHSLDRTPFAWVYQFPQLYEQYGQEESNGLRAEAWWAVQRLLNHPYWSRIWMIQEMALARKLSFICGAEEIDFDILMSVRRWFSEIQTAHFQDPGALPPNLWQQVLSPGFYHWGYLDRIEHYRGNIHHNLGFGNQMQLSEIYLNAYKYAASDPKDMIYDSLA